VDEDLSLVEANVEGANDGVLAHSQLELLCLIDLIADVILSFLNEEDLVNFIELVIDRFLGQEESGLKHFEDLDHEILILNVVPSVETVVNTDICRLFRLVLVVFGKVKELLKVLDERPEKEVLINVLLDLRWQLLKKLDIFFCAHRLILIIGPSIVEVAFNL